ncbi:MAG: DUF3109 family protein [Chloroherpetonaceae bacterium]|nr:DUF3109 family protein [Chloroherpetonaceae bacterium]
MLEPFIAYGEKLINPEILTSKFQCSLNHCKGACCVSGELGAPVTESEIAEIESILPKILPTLPHINRVTIEANGFFEQVQGELFLTAVSGRECVFAQIDESGIATCKLEEAFLRGETSFQKPLSCHLFPIRIKKKFGQDYLTYVQISECSSGRICGELEHRYLSDFLFTALKRKYGEAWAQSFSHFCERHRGDIEQV